MTRTNRCLRHVPQKACVCMCVCAHTLVRIHSCTCTHFHTSPTWFPLGTTITVQCTFKCLLKGKEWTALKPPGPLPAKLQQVFCHLSEPGPQEQLKILIYLCIQSHRAICTSCPRRHSTQTGRRISRCMLPPSTWALTHVHRMVQSLGFLFTCCCCLDY